MKHFRLAAICAAVLTVAGCTTSTPGSALGSSRALIGTDIIGAQGKTLTDQTKIDATVAGPCSVRVFTPEECRAHTKASAARRQELRGQR